MKYWEGNAYNEKIDPISGIKTWEPDPTSKAIEYTNKELEIWINNKSIPKELREFSINEIRDLYKEHQDWREFLHNNPNPTNEQKLEWFKNRKHPTKEEAEKSTAFLSFLLDNHEKLEEVLSKYNDPNTFAIPSHSLMFSLLAIFAGRPEKIPRKLLEKPYLKRKQHNQSETVLEEIGPC